MKSAIIHPLLCIALLPALLIVIGAGPSILLAADLHDDRGGLLAQYLEDRQNGNENRSGKETIRDFQKRELKKPEPHFIMGVGGGLDAREGFGSASLTAPLGVQYDRFLMIFDAAFVYSNAKSLKPDNPDLFQSLFRTKMNGQILEFHLPFKFSFMILDLEKNLYTPYLMAGIGYSYRKYYLRGSTALFRILRQCELNSLTLNLGFGFLVRTSDSTRFNVGITGTPYFNSRHGSFNYDTTGVALQVGMLFIL